MSKKLNLLLFLCVSFSLAYLLNKPLPSQIEEQWKARTYLSIVELAAKIAHLGESVGFGTWPKNFRGVLDFLATNLDSTPIPETLSISDEVFDGVPVRIYRPTAGDGRKTGAIVFYHGGGWVFGSIDTYQRLAIALATKTAIPVVSVGYRLSPEVRYPVPLEDCVKSTIHFFKNAKDSNVDPKRIVIMGDSAGGNLAAAVALRLKRFKPQILPVAQVLVYPVLQAFDFQLPAYLHNHIFTSAKGLAQHVLIYLGLDAGLADAMVANNHTAAVLKERYANVFDVTLLPEKYQSCQYNKSLHEGIPEVIEQLQQKISDPFFAPLMASPELVHGLPSTYMLTAGHDALRDDGFFYAHKLRQAGVEVKHVDYQGAYHPFLMQFDGHLRTQLASEAFEDIVKYVKQKTVSK